MLVAPTDISQLLEQGKAFEERGHYEDALARYDSILREVPEKALAVARKAYCLMRLHRHEEALAALDQASALRSVLDSLPYRGIRAKTLWHLKRYVEADEEINRVLDDAPDDVYALITKYYIARDLRNAEEALAAITHASEVAPDNAEATEQCAAALYRLKRFEEAIPLYERASELAPMDSSPVYWRGRALTDLGRYGEALAAYKQTITLSPNFAYGWRMLAITLNQLGRTNEALTACKHELAVSETAEAWHLKAMTLQKLGRPEEGATALMEAVARKPEDLQLLDTLVNFQQRLGHHEEALTMLAQALSRSLTNAHLLSNKGYSLVKLNRTDEAIAAWEQALNLRPDDATILTNLLIIYDQQKRYGDMFLPSNRLLARDSHNAYAWAARIRAFYELGRFEEAQAASIVARRLVPDDANVKTWAEIAEHAFHRPGREGHITLHDGRWMAYAEYGAPDGKPILCCHGTPGSRFDYWSEDGIAKQLGLRLIVPDRPGYGLSDPMRKQSFLRWVDDVVELADALGLAHFAVLGVSGGGPYAAACAYKLPARVTSLTLISSPAPIALRNLWPSLGWQARIAWTAQSIIPWPIFRAMGELTNRLKRSSPETLLRFQERIIGGVEKSQRPRVFTPVELESAAEPFRRSSLGQSWDSRLTRRRWGFDVKEIAVPTLVWHGEKDGQAPLMGGQYFAQNIPNCHATFYPNEGHSILSPHRREIFATLLKIDGSRSGGLAQQV